MGHASGAAIDIGLAVAEEREVVVDVKRVGRPASQPLVTLVL